MQIACPACQKQLRVPDNAAGKTVKCPACAKTFQAIEVIEEEIQAAPPKRAPKAAPPPVREEIEEEPAPRRRRDRDRDEEEDDDRPRRRRGRDEDVEEEGDRPRRRRGRDDDDEVGDRVRRKRGSGAGSTTSVGVITIILGALNLLCGLCLGIAGAFAGAGPGRFGGRNVLPFPAATGILIAIAVVILIFGVVYLMGGIGVLQRRNWGRIMTLIVAGFSGVFGVLQLIGGIITLIGPAPMEGKIVGFLINLLIAFIFLAHCIMSFMVLLNSRNAREFD